MATRLKGLTGRSKRAIVLTNDLLVVLAAFAVALFLRTGSLYATLALAIALIVALVTVVPLLSAFGLYNAVFRHLGGETVKRLGFVVLVFGLPWAAVVVIGFEGLPRTMSLLYPLTLWLMLVGSRFAAQALLARSDEMVGASGDARALIYGAGSSGRQLAAAISQSREMRVVGFIDDDAALQGKSLDRRPIVSLEDVGRTIERLGVTHVLLALPKVSRARRNEIIGGLKPYPVQVKTLPGLMHIAHGEVDASDLRDLDIEDLLGRDRVAPDVNTMRQFVEGRVVLVSGAGGSIGSELCRQVLPLGLSTLLLVERSEHALYEVHRELAEEARALGVELIPLLASVIDAPRIDRLLTTWNPHVIFHAAAYKHVPLVEANPLEGLRNNVIGTLTMARAAIAHEVGHFVLVSTDKAVRPTNVMGATKRLAEIALQRLAQDQPRKTVLTMVRFGNVLGSSGSVVPLFRRQIAAGGPVTVTHREMTRYFMLISEASQLVIQAGAMGRGGELFLLEMGEPVKIWDLASNMIQLAGARPRLPGETTGEIAVEEVGLRPGEKLYEELLIDDSANPTAHPLIRSATEPLPDQPDFWERIEDVAAALSAQDPVAATDLLRRLVPEYAFGGDADAVLVATNGTVEPLSTSVPEPAIS